MAVFFLSENDNIDRTKFKMLPAAIFISFIYDLVFLIFLQNMRSESVRVEGGMEAPVKNFALHLSYLTFAFKPFVFLILWKVSYNYLTDIKEIHEAPRITKLLKIRYTFGKEGQKRQFSQNLSTFNSNQAAPTGQRFMGI